MRIIYIAGPDVFYKERLQIGKQKKDLCLKHGFIGVYPLDLLPSNLFSGKFSINEQAKLIKHACLEGIKDCDLLIANMTPFRGVSMDVGTANEIGLAHMIGKEIYGYSLDSKSYIEKIKEDKQFSHIEGGISFDNENSLIEDFDKIDNCMVTESCVKILFPSDKEETNLSLFEKVLIEIKGDYDV